MLVFRKIDMFTQLVQYAKALSVRKIRTEKDYALQFLSKLPDENPAGR